MEVTCSSKETRLFYNICKILKKLNVLLFITIRSRDAVDLNKMLCDNII